jgi:phosphoserine phosphatase
VSAPAPPASPVPRGRTRAPDQRAAAFFDLDNTLVRGSSPFHLARGLYASNVVTARDIARFACMQLAYVVRGAEHATHVGDTRRRAACA